MDAMVSIWFGNQAMDVLVNDVPEDADDKEIRDMAWDILEMNSLVEVFRQYQD